MAEPAKPKPDFRLMDLNYWCRRQMISHWDIKKQIAFSHCSKESFKLVKSLNQKPTITITLENRNWITVDVGDVRSCLIKLVDHEIAIPGYATPINFGLDARDAFVHLCEMYQNTKLVVRLNPYSITPVDAVRAVLDGFPIEEIIYSDGTNREAERDYIMDMLEFLLPSKLLLISRNPYDTYQEFRDEVLQFEYETIILQSPAQINILDLKAINIEINKKIPSFQRRLLLTTQQFQGFIQKWIKSETYPKFKKIVVHAGLRDVEMNYQEKILEGLLYQQLPNDWTCDSFAGGPFLREHMADNGIYEVQREADGQKAAICFQSFRGSVLWKFFVV
ncbi:unnamed protein product [Caenorhabditis nigoni]